ncbi:hypothetical protein [Halomarina oriensis]|uniref:Uncharacterized protein n=1 Tax=Halomarina oriensis TaxID=671145 RepID=A0A6B0GK19_9EURY|nr:hypothetical protein [Halomarina oriensis]MWG33143.1 hypothetical protein [Halomarina oriensis]
MTNSSGSGTSILSYDLSTSQNLGTWQGVEEDGGRLGDAATRAEQDILASNDWLTDSEQVRIIYDEQADEFSATLTEQGQAAIADRERETLERRLASKSGRLDIAYQSLNAQYSDVDSTSIRYGDDGEIVAEATLGSGDTVTESYYFGEEFSAEDYAITEEDGRLNVEFTDTGLEDAMRQQVRATTGLADEQFELTQGEDGRYSAQFSTSEQERRRQTATILADAAQVNMEQRRNAAQSDEIDAALDRAANPGKVRVVEDPFDVYGTGTDVLNAAEDGRLEEQTERWVDPKDTMRERVEASTGLNAEDFRVDGATELVKTRTGDLDGRTTYDVALTDSGVATVSQRTKREVAAETPGFDPSEVLVDYEGGAWDVSFAQEGQQAYQEANQRPERFGDDGGRVAFVPGGEDFLDGLSRDYQGFARDAGELTSTISPVGMLERRTTGTNFVGNFAAGTTEGALAIANVPATVRGLDEFGELAAWYGGRELAGEGKDARKKVSATAEMAAVSAWDSVTANPSKGAGQLVGSLVGSYGAIAGASRVSSTAGRSAAWAIQPGEELLSTGATRLFPSVAAKFPGGRIDNEEIIIREGKRAYRGAKQRVGEFRADQDFSVRDRLPGRDDGSGFDASDWVTVERDADAGLVKLSPALKYDTKKALAGTNRRLDDARLGIDNAKTRLTPTQAGLDATARSLGRRSARSRQNRQDWFEQARDSTRDRALRTAVDTQTMAWKGREALAATPDRLRGLATTGTARTQRAWWDAEIALGDLADSSTPTARGLAMDGALRAQAGRWATEDIVGSLPGRTRSAAGSAALRAQSSKWDIEEWAGSLPGRGRDAGLSAAVRGQTAKWNTEDWMAGLGPRARENARQRLPAPLQSQANLNDAAWRAGYRFEQDRQSSRLDDVRNDLGIDLGIARGRLADTYDTRRRRASDRLFRTKERVKRPLQDFRSGRADVGLSAARLRGQFDAATDSLSDWDTDLPIDAALARGQLSAGLDARRTSFDESVRSGLVNAQTKWWNAKSLPSEFTIQVGSNRLYGNVPDRRDYSLDADAVDLEVDGWSDTEKAWMRMGLTEDIDDLTGPSTGRIESGFTPARSGDQMTLLRMGDEVNPNRLAELELDNRSRDAFDLADIAGRAEVAGFAEETSTFDPAAIVADVAGEQRVDMRDIVGDQEALVETAIESKVDTEFESLIESEWASEWESEWESEFATEWESAFEVERAMEWESEFEMEMELEFETELESESEMFARGRQQSLDDLLGSGPSSEWSKRFTNDVASLREVFGR